MFGHRFALPLSLWLGGIASPLPSLGRTSWRGSRCLAQAAVGFAVLHGRCASKRLSSVDADKPFERPDGIRALGEVIFFRAVVCPPPDFIRDEWSAHHAPGRSQQFPRGFIEAHRAVSPILGKVIVGYGKEAVVMRMSDPEHLRRDHKIQAPMSLLGGKPSPKSSAIYRFMEGL